MATSAGWVKIFRKIMDADWYQSRPYDKAHAWLDLLLSATFTEKEIVRRGRKIMLKPGMVAAGMEELAERWGWSRAKVIRYIESLKLLGQVTVQKSNHGTVIAIRNWEAYQSEKIDWTPNDTPNDTAERTYNDTAERTAENGVFLVEKPTEPESDDTAERTYNDTAERTANDTANDTAVGGIIGGEEEKKKRNKERDNIIAREMPEEVRRLFADWIACWETFHGAGRRMRKDQRELHLADLLRIPAVRREECLRAAIKGAWKNIHDIAESKNMRNSKNDNDSRRVASADAFDPAKNGSDF